MSKLLTGSLYSVSSGEDRWFVVADSVDDAEQTIKDHRNVSLESCSTEFVAKVHYVSQAVYDEETELREEASKVIVWTSRDGETTNVT